MPHIYNILSYFIPFVFLIVVVTFIHELGHYLVARLFNVRVTDFAIGFGKELFGFKDKNNTKWKICLLPFGGYVKMFGDENAASFNVKKKLNPTEDELKYSILYKKPYQKFFISLFGPVANFILAFLIFVNLFYFAGISKTKPIIGTILENSIADKIGLEEGDKILSVNNQAINDFKEIKKIILFTKEKEIKLTINRDEKILSFDIKFEENQDKILGIGSKEIYYEKTNFIDSVKQAVYKIHEMNVLTLKAVGMMIKEKHNRKHIGGPIRIMQESKNAGQSGLYGFCYFIAIISINLGLINLFPIPMLDGGHLVTNAVEMIIRRPLPNIIYLILSYLGLIFIGFLTVFSFGNDLYNTFISK